MRRFYLPLGLCVLLLLLLLAGLGSNPSVVPSPLIGKPAPDFELPHLQDPASNLSPHDLRGQVWVLNVWASWCTACIEEHPQIMRHLKDEVMLVGLNYKDDDVAARQWLQRWGNPYALSATDRDGRAGIDWGVYGVPETFVIDKNGIIRYKHIGPLTDTDITTTIVPLVRRLSG